MQAGLSLCCLHVTKSSLTVSYTDQCSNEVCFKYENIKAKV